MGEESGRCNPCPLGAGLLFPSNWDAVASLTHSHLGTLDHLATHYKTGEWDNLAVKGSDEPLSLSPCK